MLSSQTDGEWRDLYLGAMPGPNVTKDNTKVFQMSSDSKPPKAVDWRSKKAVCPVKDQVRGVCREGRGVCVLGGCYE